jgi:hypothetical protein
MSIEIRNLEIIERKIQKRLDAIEPAFQAAIEAERNVIEARTLTGIGVNGRPLKKYSTKHEWNWRDVRRVNGFQIAYVDLKFTGDMFEALKTAFKRDGTKFLATIFFNDRKQAQKAKGHQTGQLGPTTYEPRRFFGLSKSQRGTIISKIRNAK